MYNLFSFKRRIVNASPFKIIASSFLGVILFGTFLLMLPISSSTGTFTPFIDSLFTATSATCVTGLVVYDTYTHFSGFGQAVILFLIQIGGLGLVTLVSFFNLVIGKKLGYKTLSLTKESVNVNSRIEVLTLTKNVVKIAFTVEAIGAFLLALVFVPKYGLQGIFISIFLAISAFCNAGFDILGFEEQFISLTNYASNPIILITIGLLIIIGGIGFVVILDIINWRKTRKLTLLSKVILGGAAILLVVGTIGFAVLEWNNVDTIGNMTVIEKLGNSLFQSITTRTAGFNTFDNGAMTELSKILSLFLMFIGAAPGSTGGGIKIVTMMIILSVVACIVRGKTEITISKHKINQRLINKSFTVALLGIVIVAICSMALYYNSPGVEGIDAVFEAVSAFATVGLSTGVTAVTNTIGKIVMIITMYIGRIGPISFGLFLALKAKSAKNEIIPDAKLIVG